jgi:hypothetical protein
MQIKFNPGSVNYTLVMDDNKKTTHDSKDEAEFYYVHRYIDHTVKGYSDYKVRYANDGETVVEVVMAMRMCINFFQAKAKADSVLKKDGYILTGVTANEIRKYFAKHIKRLPENDELFHCQAILSDVEILSY